jgi:glycosyltransferase involved in cell wall biosynthesis
MACSDQRVRCVGSIYDASILNGLYQNCYCYLHGHEVGGTNPSLLRAMQAGAPCVAIDVVFTREVLTDVGLYFSTESGDLAKLLSRIDTQPEELATQGAALQERANAEYRWDAVAAAFLKLFRTLLQFRQAGRNLRDAQSIEVYSPHDSPGLPIA